MADNTVQTGADTIATDDVTTLNGGASTGVKVQRVKATFGDDGTARDVSATFPLPIVSPVSSTGTITSATSAAVSTLLLAANTARLAAAVHNDSTAVLYLALAGAASTTAYTVQVPAGGFYELPNDECRYVGTIYGIWAAANGAARVTELT